MGSVLWGLECFFERGGCSMEAELDDGVAVDSDEVNDLESI